MRAREVYYDYDGVFGDTMTPAVKEMKANGMYETEEGRTKYFRELNWIEFLQRAGFIKNSPEAINALNKLGYGVSFLTHINSLDEYIAKINFIKNIEVLENAKEINVIAVPRIIDKSTTINPKGNFLVDDRLENIINWEAMGGIGIYFSEVQHESYITISDPMDLINIALSFDESEYAIYLSGDPIKDEMLLKKVKEKCGKVPVNNDDIIVNINQKLRRYKYDIECARKMHASIASKHLVIPSYDYNRMEEIFKTLEYYNNIGTKKILSTYKFSDSIYYDLLTSLLQLSMLNSNDKKSKILTKSYKNNKKSFKNY
ncbi:MAG: hypothetical protein PHI05_02735 [Bacilli bacterium]|nr:hypothetical protein [Bacilli bacterium]